MGRLGQLLDPRIHQLLERTFGRDWRSKVVHTTTNTKRSAGSRLVRLPSGGFRSPVDVRLPTSVPASSQRHRHQEGPPPSVDPLVRRLNAFGGQDRITPWAARRYSCVFVLSST